MPYIYLLFNVFQIINKFGPDQMYEYIGQLVGKSSSEVRSDLVQFIFNNMREAAMFAGDYFSRIGLTQGEYILCVACSKNRADELAICLIAQIYKLHLATVLSQSIWFTCGYCHLDFCDMYFCYVNKKDYVAVVKLPGKDIVKRFKCIVHEQNFKKVLFEGRSKRICHNIKQVFTSKMNIAQRIECNTHEWEDIYV